MAIASDDAAGATWEQPMRIAVMSDIHGFSLALARTLDDLDRTGPFDEVIVAGDLCEVGPAPDEVLDRLRSGPLTVLQGNTDRDVAEADAVGLNDPAIDFALARIGLDGVDYLGTLPFSRRITPPGGTSPDDDLLAVHANPNDLDQKLAPEMSDRELRDVIGDARAAVLAFGHHHVAYTRRLGEMLLVDVSAVGNPKDRDLRSRYGVFTWDPQSRAWAAEHRYVPYPIEETEAQIRASGLPDPERTIRKLLRASY